MRPSAPTLLPADAADPRIAELRRMRGLATALLVLMAVIFVAASYLVGRWPWLGYVQAFVEAAMVGACADWFAVVALFRHPLGIPIPHTAIVPRNKLRIGDAIGRFIDRNFLAPSVVTQRLAAIDAVGWWTRYLARPENAALVAYRTAGALAPIVELLEREPIHALLCRATEHGLREIPASLLAGRILEVLKESGQLVVLIDRAIAFAETTLARNEELVRAKVAQHSVWWIPKWVDERMTDRVMTGARKSLSELKAEDHPWRGQLLGVVDDLIRRLASDPELIAQGERLKEEILENPAVAAWIDALWRDLEGLLKDNAVGSAVLEAQIERALASFARSLGEDDALRRTLNGWLQRAIELTVVSHRTEIGDYIASVVKRWDDRTLVRRMELTFGKDLQYVRINGTLVGGLVGLLIYVATRLLPL